jgi:hypothetical protein
MQIASYTRYLVHDPQSPTVALTVSTPFIQSLNSLSRSFSSEETENDCELKRLIAAVGNRCLSNFSVTSKICGAARLLLHKSPIFLPSSLSSFGANPYSGIGSVFAQGLSTS